MKILFVQFANSMFPRFSVSDGYWDAFYDTRKDFGYYRMNDAFEIPKWIAEACYFLPVGCEKRICWVKLDIEEAIYAIKHGDYDYVMFSVMTCTKGFTRKIIEKSPSTQKFIIGGYDKEIYNIAKEFKNVTSVDSMRENAEAMDLEYLQGTDYCLFEGWNVLPRLTLSYGCMNNCKFCIVPHKIETVSEEVIVQQVDSFRHINFKLIYIDDKTFGQADNYKILGKLKGRILQYNKDFKGFVVQTTSGMLVKKAEEFNEIGVVVAEIGVETFNDSILKAYRKPSSEKMVMEAIDAAEKNGIKLIPNIIVGFEEETEETYKKTMDFLLNNHDRLFGVNFAMYTDYSREDCVGEVDFLDSPKIELHRKWWHILNVTACANILKSPCK